MIKPLDLVAKPPESQKRISKPILYGLFATFVCVNLFEGIVINHTSEKGVTKYNFATTFVFDAIFRVLIAIMVLFKTKESIKSSFQGFEWKQWAKFAVARALLQFGELFSLFAAIKLTSATNQVIQNARIPLVGLMSFLILRSVLTRDQYIYAFTILPLVAIFTIDDAKFEADWIGYTLAGLSLACVPLANTFVENILQNDLQHLSVWQKQILNATIEIPIMFAIYFAATAFDMYVASEPDVVVRTFNPFDKPNMENWYWLLLISLNGAVIALVRLSILNYTDALWLNLLCVLNMGFLWLSEVIDRTSMFSAQKLLTLIALICVLVGYELAEKAVHGSEEDL